MGVEEAKKTLHIAFRASEGLSRTVVVNKKTSPSRVSCEGRVVGVLVALKKRNEG